MAICAAVCVVAASSDQWRSCTIITCAIFVLFCFVLFYFASLSYAELSPFFGPLEHFAQSYGNDEAGNLLRRATVSFVRDFASKRGRQVDMREFAQA